MDETLTPHHLVTMYMDETLTPHHLVYGRNITPHHLAYGRNINSAPFSIWTKH